MAAKFVPDIERIRKALLKWYRRHQRPMPWRNTRDPYAIWVSEIMLQQTRVETVIPYFLRFLREFSTVESLAGADPDRLLKLWEGLGYYSRVRNLQKAAGVVVREFGGKLPDQAEQLRTLPGIGAIASIAFGRDEPVLDGNVKRVLCRLFCLGPKRSDEKSLWAMARKLLPAGRASEFNQGLMDLGATLCLPRSPLCEQCPLASECFARATGRQERFPAARPAKPLPHQQIVAGVIRKGDKILIDRRKSDALLGGLWEFPGGKVERGETLPEALVREVREELGIAVAVGERLAVVKHAYSHFRITLHAFECVYRGGRPRAIGCDRWKWITAGELGEYAFPKANHAILEKLRGELGAK